MASQISPSICLWPIIAEISPNNISTFSHPTLPVTTYLLPGAHLETWMQVLVPILYHKCQSCSSSRPDERQWGSSIPSSYFSFEALDFQADKQFRCLQTNPSVAVHLLPPIWRYAHTGYSCCRQGNIPCQHAPTEHCTSLELSRITRKASCLVEV